MLHYLLKYLPKNTVNTLFLLSIALLTACSEESANKPDVVLITLDTTRWDYLHTYNYELPNTPNLDKLSSLGTRYLNAVSVAGTTFPAHASMLTGNYPRSHGARSNFHRLNDDTRTVAQILTENGYQSGSFVSFKGMHNHGRLDRGFEAASDRARKPSDKTSIRPGNETLALTLDWLGTTNTESPAFLWMHLFEPHGPYDITPWFEENYPDYKGRFKDGVTMQQITNARQIGFPDSDIDAMRQIYAGEIELADQYVGTLIETLKARGNLDNTVLIIVADHGQGMGENGHFGHGALLWESVLRVPMVIVDFRNPEPAIVEQRVGIIDITPTILKATGLKIPGGIAGRPLYPLNSPEDGKDRLYYSEVNLMEKPDEKTQRWYDPDDLAVYLGEFKLQHRKGKNKLFSTVTDSNKLTAIPLKKSESLYYFLSDSVDAFLENEGEAQSAELNSEALKELQGLGYTQ